MRPKGHIPVERKLSHDERILLEWLMARPSSGEYTGVRMQSEIKVGQRFTFNILSDNPSQERQAVVTRVLSNREEGLGPEVDFYLAYWVEAYELPETEASKTLVFERGTDGNVYLDGRVVTISLLKGSSA